MFPRPKLSAYGSPTCLSPLAEVCPNDALDRQSAVNDRGYEQPPNKKPSARQSRGFFFVEKLASPYLTTTGVPGLTRA